MDEFIAVKIVLKLVSWLRTWRMGHTACRFCRNKFKFAVRPAVRPLPGVLDSKEGEPLIPAADDDDGRSPGAKDDEALPMSGTMKKLS